MELVERVFLVAGAGVSVILVNITLHFVYTVDYDIDKLLSISTSSELTYSK